MPPEQRRRRQVVEDESSDDATPREGSPENGNGDSDNDGDEQMGGVNGDSTSQLIKKLVRYALACEHARTPIRREGIKEKVLEHHGREFRKVFNGAQKQLQAVFGMEMVELPTKDRNLLTAEQKRKVAKSGSQRDASSNAWILVTTLPEQYRTPGIIGPSKVQSMDGEASYTAIYSLLVALITLSGGELSDPRLRRHLSRLNAGDNMPSMNPNDPNAPSEKTELVLQRMIRQGYLIRVTEARTQGDDESTTWHVGPRGKVEVPPESCAELVRKVYGGSTEDLESKLQTSLGIEERKTRLAATGEEEEEEGGEEEQEEEQEEQRQNGARGGRRRAREVGMENGDPGPSTTRRRSRRGAAQEEEE